jgi:hypothetical protein
MDFEKHDQDEAQQAFLPKPREDVPNLESGWQEMKSTSRQYWRLALEILMASVIVVLLTRVYIDRKVARPLAVPQCMFLSMRPKLMWKH